MRRRPLGLAAIAASATAVLSAAAAVAGLALLSLARSPPAQADVLMFDLNLSKDEVDAAREAVRERNAQLKAELGISDDDDPRLERLVLLPDIKRSLRQEFKDAQFKVNRAQARLDQAKKKLAAAFDRNADNFSELDAEMLNREVELREAADSLSKLTARHRDEIRVTPDLYRQKLAELKKSKRVITTQIVSGHSNGLEFWGLQDEISREQLLAVAKEYPETAMASLTSVLLWGCYSAERGDVEWWKSSHRGLKVLLGYSGKAPSAATDASPRILKAALLDEAKFSRAATLNDAKKALQALEGGSDTYLVGATHSCYVGMQIDSVMLGSTEDCDGVKAKLKDGFAHFGDCLEANDRCPDSPADPTARTPLRAFYNTYLYYAHCAKVSDYVRSLPKRERILALIFFYNVRKNFAAHFEKQAASVNKLLRKHGIEPGLPDFGSGSLTRQKALSELKRVRKAIDQSGKPELKKSKEARALLENADTLLNHLKCLPMTWMTEEPDEHNPPKTPEC